MADIGEILRTTVRYSSLGASEQLNIFHHVVAVSDVDDDEAGNALNAFILNDWAPDWANMAPTSSALTDIAVDVVDVEGLVIRAIATYLIGQSGLAGGTVASAAVSAYLLLKSEFPKVRGVKYVPAISEDQIEDGEMTAPALANMALLLIEYATSIDAFGSAELVPGVPSKSLLTFVPFLDTGIIESIPAYQRRRKPNVGS